MLELLTVEQVAERLHVTERTVWRYARDHGLPITKVVGRRFFREDDIAAWIESQNKRSVP